MTKRFRKVCQHCSTVVHAIDSTAVGEPENAMKRRNAQLLPEEELLVRDKVCKVSMRASETREQILH